MDLFFLLIWFAVCAEQDARQKEISNWLTLGIAALALAFLAYTGHTWLGAHPDDAGQAAVIALALTLPGHALRRLGAADVKLLLALALASDTLHLLGTFIGAAIALAAWALAGKYLWPLLNQRLTRRYLLMSPGMTNKYPFSPFLFIGLVAVSLLIR
ncbi:MULTISPECIES: prepilin peptidase [Pseudomonas]|uniref:Prepilin peptidase n=2 Tax=Pseudomonas TaxID=286 RepID=A0ABX6H7W3_9PSED|nr:MULTISPECIES: prepilin peptidase [Pseudomonas]MBC3956984.1 prepilin peptidase [Pseudomonas triticifolii]QHF01616.1 prepilin peptidase [Pseudomonas asturiensis]